MAEARVRTNLLLRIRAMLPSLNDQEQKVGRYVLGHPAEIVHLAMSDLAQRCSASDATIFRFCRKVGTEGYQDLKIRLAQDLVTEPTATYQEVQESDSLEVAARKVVAAGVKALEDTLKVLDPVALERVVDALLAANRVDIYGLGGAAVSALELQYKLVRVGIRAVVHMDSEMEMISATLLGSGDVAIGISHSGASEGVRQALAEAKRNGATTVAITNHPLSPLGELADIQLCTAAPDALGRDYPLGARIAQVALSDMLYACLALRRPEETHRSLDRIARALYHRHA